jgi:hypothetical protein
MDHPPVFIVGTGRCGSTLLSGFLRAHAQVLSLSEFWVFISDLGGRIAEAFPEGEVSGTEFWPLLAGAHPRQTLMLRNDVMMDEALYRPGPGRRYTHETGVPALVATTLTHLCAEPELLFDALQAEVEQLPPAPIGRQYRSVFNSLRDRFGASIWVERSGGSLRLVHRLRQHFPEARFVHIVRDGRDTALSMSRHLGFRLALINAQLTEILGVDPFEDPDRRFESDLPDELIPFLPERFEADTFRDWQIALPLCGHYWAGEIQAGLQELAGLGEDKLLTLRYEQILSSPTTTLERLFQFLLPDAPLPDLAAMASQVREPRSDWRSLPADVLNQLEIACAPGFRALEAVP